MINSYGLTEYRSNTVYINLGREFAEYYSSLVPKYKRVKLPKYPAHITIVREFERPNRELWGLKLYLNFRYLPLVMEDEVYYYINVYSSDISDVREMFGLSRFRVRNCYHITIGNKKCG
jgi:hypothetical protein